MYPVIVIQVANTTIIPSHTSSTHGSIRVEADQHHQCSPRPCSGKRSVQLSWRWLTGRLSDVLFSNGVILDVGPLYNISKLWHLIGWEPNPSAILFLLEPAAEDCRFDYYATHISAIETSLWVCKTTYTRFSRGVSGNTSVVMTGSTRV